MGSLEKMVRSFLKTPQSRSNILNFCRQAAVIETLTDALYSVFKLHAYSFSMAIEKISVPLHELKSEGATSISLISL